MRLFEYEAKAILAGYGVPVPRGALAATKTQAKKEAALLHPPYVVKAQALVAGRGKAGGIQFAKTLEEVENAASRLLNMEIKELKVDNVWVEEKARVKREVYFAVTVDRSRRCYVAIASPSGGMDIEDVAAKTPESIIRTFVSPSRGFKPFHARQMAGKIGYSGKQMLRLAAIFEKLYEAAMDYDAELVEVNPLAETVDGEFVAVDARLIIDDSALYRHPQYKKRLLSGHQTELSPEEIKARETGFAYVKLDGNIGVLGNGAGLVMATLDALQLYGGKPANFLDVGGGASEERILSALNILLSDQKTSVVFVNILGGITRCDNVARGILEAKENANFDKPMVIRLVGTNEEEGRRLLSEAGINVLDSMEDAAKKAVATSRDSD